VGFGLSNDERAGTTADFAAAFQIARRGGLALVPHGGELLGPDHVDQVVTSLLATPGPSRLGHGVRLAEDLRLLDAVVARGIALEVCPASNVSLGVFDDVGDVPLRALVEHGAVVALGADDPLLFDSRLTDQYETARTVLGFSDDELADLARGSVRASLARADVKDRLLRGIEAWLAAPPDEAR